MTQQWPVRPAEFPVAFPKFGITEADLLNANLDEEDAIQLKSEHRQEIADIFSSRKLSTVSPTTNFFWYPFTGRGFS
jgi:hypothetical protein